MLRVEGRCLGVVARDDSPSGYIDLDHDDFKDGTLLDKLQKIASGLIYPHIQKS